MKANLNSCVCECARRKGALYAFEYATLSMLIIGPQCDKIISEYDKEIPQSQTADNLLAPRERATQPSKNNKQSNQLSLPHRDEKPAVEFSDKTRLKPVSSATETSWKIEMSLVTSSDMILYRT